jgi:hypothetical protein
VVVMAAVVVVALVLVFVKHYNNLEKQNKE